MGVQAVWFKPPLRRGCLNSGGAWRPGGGGGWEFWWKVFSGRSGRRGRST